MTEPRVTRSRAKELVPQPEEEAAPVPRRRTRSQGKQGASNPAVKAKAPKSKSRPAPKTNLKTKPAAKAKTQKTTQAVIPPKDGGKTGKDAPAQNVRFEEPDSASRLPPPKKKAPRPSLPLLSDEEEEVGGARDVRLPSLSRHTSPAPPHGEIESDEDNAPGNPPADARNLFDTDEHVITRTHVEHNTSAQRQPLVTYTSSPGFDDSDYENENERDASQGEFDDDRSQGGENDDDDEGEPNEEDGGTNTHAGPGRMATECKAELDAANQEYEEKLGVIADKYKVTIQACRIHLDEVVRRPREETNMFNAFQRWFSVHGEEKRPENMPLSEWNKEVREKYWKYLDERVPKEKRDDLEARRKALAEIIEWYENCNHDYMEDVKRKGKYRKTVNAMVKPLVAMGKQMHKFTGSHVFGYVIHTGADADGKSRSIIFAGSDMARHVLDQYKVNVDAHLTDLEALIRRVFLLSLPTYASFLPTVIRLQEMQDRGIEASFGNLVNGIRRKQGESARDQQRRAISLAWIYDIEQLKEQKTSQLGPTRFIENAFRYHVRVENWPVDAPIFGISKQTIHNLTATQTKAIGLPRIKDIFADYESQVGIATGGFERRGFHIVEWTEEELRTPFEDQGRIPIVTDTRGNTVVTVSASQAYQERLKQFNDDHSDDDFAPQLGSKSQQKRTNQVSLYEDLDDDEDDQDLDRQSHPPPPPSEPQTRPIAAPLNSLPPLAPKPPHRSAPPPPKARFPPTIPPSNTRPPVAPKPQQRPPPPPPPRPQPRPIVATSKSLPPGGSTNPLLRKPPPPPNAVAGPSRLSAKKRGREGQHEADDEDDEIDDPRRAKKARKGTSSGVGGK